MLRVGLTGGIASGKSSVAAMFARRGARVIRADEIAHGLMRPGEPVYAEVVSHFGREIVQEDGSIDRARLAEEAFGGGRIEELNRIVHPAVVARQEQWMNEVAAEDAGAVAMVEAALILEAGVASRFDKIVVVTCETGQRAQRFAARSGMGLQQAGVEVERRMKVQMPESEKVKHADYVVDNSGPLAATERQVERIYADLRSLSAASR